LRAAELGANTFQILSASPKLGGCCEELWAMREPARNELDIEVGFPATKKAANAATSRR
jgi:hypothetical protein